MREGSLNHEQIQDMSEYKLNLPLSSLGLSERSYNCLTRTGIDKIGKLIGMFEGDLLNVRNLGQAQIEEIKEKVAEIGLKFRDYED